MNLPSTLKGAQSFIFGGNTGLSYEDMKRQRALAALMAQRVASASPQNVGQGFQALTGALVSRKMGERADAAATEGREKAQSALGALLQGRLGGVQPPSASFLPSGGGVAAPAGGGLPASIVETESGGNWGALNSEGYGGRGQFGAERLADAARAGIIPAGMTGADYSRAPEQVQLAVENWHKQDILSKLGGYVGTDVDGPGGIPPLTPDSILAVAHLGGTGGAKKFIESGGRYNPADSNGTSLADYAKRHAGGDAMALAEGQQPDLSFVSQMGGQGIDPQLLAVMADPYVSELPEMQQGALAALFERQLAQAYPEQMTPYQQAQIEMERQRLAMQMQPDPVKPIEVNGQLVDPTTGQVLGDYRDEAGAGGTEYGLNPQYGVDAQGNPVIVQLGKDGSAVQTALPEGVTFQKEPIRLDAGTHYVLLDPISRQPVGQIPKDIAGAAAAEVTGKAQGEATVGLGNAVAKADQAIGLLQGIRNDPALPGITGMVQGRLPPMSQAGTDLNVRIEQAKGQVFLEAFQSLKGGGAITELEGKKAEQAIARMDRAQSLGAYQAALDELIGVIQAGKQRAAAKAGQAPPNAPAASPATVGRLRFNPATGELE